jgi:outer membrane protein insertion porin family
MGSHCGQGQAQDAPTLVGRPVLSLQLQCDCNLNLQKFPGAITQQSGKPLDPANISESLKRLYATGRFAELRAEGVREGDGVVVTFVARAQYFIGIITAEGNPSAVETRALVTASRLRLGQPLTEDDLAAAHKRLNDLLISNGYYRAVITHRIERNPDTLEANVAFDIKAGSPARVSAVQFIDDSGFPPERLMKVSGWRPHLYLTAARIERGLYRLRQFYVAQGRIQANINVQQRIYDNKSNTETVLVRAQGGPLLRCCGYGCRVHPFPPLNSRICCPCIVTALPMTRHWL